MKAEVWLGGLLLGLITYASRSLPLLVNLRPPDKLRPFLDAVAPAVVAALLVPALLLPEGRWIAPWQNPALLAAIPASWVALRTRSLGWTTLVGVAAYAVLSHWVG